MDSRKSLCGCHVDATDSITSHSATAVLESNYNNVQRNGLLEMRWKWRSRVGTADEARDPLISSVLCHRNVFI
jgi:hypothetical protein